MRAHVRAFSLGVPWPRVDPQAVHHPFWRPRVQPAGTRRAGAPVNWRPRWGRGLGRPSGPRPREAVLAGGRRRLALEGPRRKVPVWLQERELPAQPRAPHSTWRWKGRCGNGVHRRVGWSGRGRACGRARGLRGFRWRVTYASLCSVGEAVVMPFNIASSSASVMSHPESAILHLCR